METMDLETAKTKGARPKTKGGQLKTKGGQSATQMYSPFQKRCERGLSVFFSLWQLSVATAGLRGAPSVSREKEASSSHEGTSVGYAQYLFLTPIVATVDFDAAGAELMQEGHAGCSKWLVRNSVYVRLGAGLQKMI